MAYYVSEMSPKIHHTMGGIATDTSTRVLSVVDDKPIPGLYAAGECTGGIHGAVRIGANAVMDCLVNGKLAGEEELRHPLRQQHPCRHGRQTQDSPQAEGPVGGQGRRFHGTSGKAGGQGHCQDDRQNQELNNALFFFHRLFPSFLTMLCACVGRPRWMVTSHKFRTRHTAHRTLDHLDNERCGQH